MLIAYERKNFHLETRNIIHSANKIIGDYVDQGMLLTVRQLYYRFISLDLLPESWADPTEEGSKNTQKNYKRLAVIFGKARMGGLMDWNAIEDRTRNLQKKSHWESPEDIIWQCSKSFAIDRWIDQCEYVELWFEKDALIGVFEEPCLKYDVPFFSCRGYGSLSELWKAGQRIKEMSAHDKSATILHFGDHDPSGIDMTRDIQERLSIFAESHVSVERIALNMDQVKEHQPPPNPAKVKDTRFKSYFEQFGRSCWELDALEPSILRELAEETILEHLYVPDFEAAINKENEQKNILEKASLRWCDVEKYLQE